jgi:ribosomal protein S18 acetylase RimI-like enzyme
MSEHKKLHVEELESLSPAADGANSTDVLTDNINASHVLYNEVMDNITIRPAEEKDANDIAKVHITSWQNTYKGQVPDSYLENLPSTIEDRANKWKETLAKHERGLRVLVAEAGKDIVGFCIVNASRDEDMAKDVGEVGAIYVDPKFLKKGIGAQLMSEGLAFLSEEGFNKVTLWVLTTNVKAREWYEKNGWKVEGKTKVEDRNDVQLHETRYITTLKNV